MITPQHVLLLAWPVIAAVSVYAGTQMKNILSVQTATETVGGPSRVFSYYSTVQVEQPGKAVCLGIQKAGGGLKEMGGGGELTRHRGLMLVKVQQAL